MTQSPQYIILFHHFRRFLDAANGEGIDVVPLKGAHLLTGVYPMGEERGVLSDVDFIVRPQHWVRSLEIIRRLGFYSREHFNDESLRFEQGFHFDVGERIILFEAHRYLFEPRRFPIDHVALWNRAFDSSFDGVRCMRFAAEDHFCHIAFHSCLHRLMNLPRAFRDLELLIRNGDEQLLSNIVERARQWRVTRCVWLYLYLLNEKFDDLELGDAIDALCPSLPISYSLNYLVNSTTQTRLSGLNHRLQAAIIWPLLFDSPTALGRMLAGHPRLVPLMERFFS